MAPVVPASSLDNSSQAAVQSSVAGAQSNASNPNNEGNPSNGMSDGKQYVIIDGVRYVVETASFHNASPLCNKHDAS